MLECSRSADFTSRRLRERIWTCHPTSLFMAGACQSSWPHAPAVAGAVSGAAQVLAEHPLDSLKVRLQSRLRAFTVVGGGPLAMLRHTLRAEGAAALYQGLGPRLLTNSLVKLSLFSLYEQWLPLCGGSPLLAGG